MLTTVVEMVEIIVEFRANIKSSHKPQAFYDIHFYYPRLNYWSEKISCD